MPPVGPTVDRRTFLRGLGGLAAVAPLGELAWRPPLPTADAGDGDADGHGVFRHGVASGDPTPDGVVIWTRVSGTGDGPVEVEWVVAGDERLTNRVRSGRVDASPDRDYTVHVAVEGLAPATTYWYGFRAAGQKSPTGRTRTAPQGRVERLRLGVCSCARYSDGFFNAYAGLAAADVDVVVHLGDYIYEEADDGPRGQGDDRPRIAVTLADYRGRYAEARGDSDLQELHRRHPMAAIWDDHEFADNAWVGGAADHDPEKDGPWEERRRAAARAWREWMPVRLPDADEPMRIWRALAYGDLVDLVLVDTRLAGRDEQVTGQDLDHLDRPDRTILGEKQESWLAERLGRPGPTWLLLANQVVLTPLKVKLPEGVPDRVAEDVDLVVSDGTAFNADQWDGYPAAQRRLLDRLSARPGGGVVVLTGDIHSSMALESSAGAGLPAVTEIVAPAVTTTALGERLGPLADQVFDALVADEGQVRWASLFEHGFVVIDVTPERLAAEWWHVEQIKERGGSWTFAAGFQRAPGTGGLTRLGQPSAGSASLARRAGPPDDDWYEALLSLPGGLGAAALAASAAVLLHRRRSGPGPGPPDDGEGDRPASQNSVHGTG